MILKKFTLMGIIMLAFAACSSPESQEDNSANAETQEAGPGQSAVQDNVSEPNILNVAINSPDHTTLVAAVKAADLVDALANAGPFSVFAPVNSAFDALPAGTVDDLLKPENKETLKQILLGHVTTTAYSPDYLGDGMVISMVNESFTKWTITHKDGAIYIGDAKILGSVKASNGYVHVIDKVLLP